MAGGRQSMKQWNKQVGFGQPGVRVAKSEHDADAHNSLAAVEAMLAGLQLEHAWSTKQLKSEVRERGICLRNGKAYGTALPVVLKKHPNLLVGKREAKEFKLARACLVGCREP